MVEVDVLVVPGLRGRLVTRVNKGLVDRRQILHTAHRADELVRGLSDVIVVRLEAEREPSLLDLGINSASDVEVRVDLVQDFNGHAIAQRVQSVAEDGLEVRGVVVESIVAGRRLSSLDVSGGQGNRLIQLSRGEVKEDRSETSALNPQLEVNHTLNLGVVIGEVGLSE